MFNFAQSFQGSYGPRILAYIFGGAAGSNPSIQSFDGNSISTQSATILNLGYQSGSYLNQFIFLFGGSGGFNSNFSSAIQRFDVNLKIRTTDSSTLSYGVSSSSSLNMGAKINIFGGTSGGGPTNTIQKYDGVSSGTESQSLTYSILESCSTNLNGFGYIFGGYANSGSIQKWTGINSSVDNATLVNICYLASSSYIGNNAYIFGGSISTSASDGYYAIEKYDGTTRSTVSSVYMLYCATGASPVNNGIHIFGGQQGYQAPINQIILFDGITTSFKSATLSNGVTFPTVVGIIN
jgi:hypothetical protein